MYEAEAIDRIEFDSAIEEGKRVPTLLSFPTPVRFRERARLER